MNLRDAYNLSLPKWPQFKLTGASVTQQQAIDIIRRTDTFLRAGSLHGGNNKTWEAWAKRELGFNLLSEPDNNKQELNDWQSDWNKYYEICHEINKRLGCVGTAYLHNNWASSAFIYGAHGWLHPSGHVYHGFNLGKWPTVAEVVNDLRLLLKAFPYLNLVGTLYDSEYCETPQPVVTLIARKGRVSASLNHDQHHKVHPSINTSNQDVDLDAVFDRRTEQGLPDQFIVDYGKITQPIVKAVLKEFKMKAQTKNKRGAVLLATLDEILSKEAQGKKKKPLVAWNTIKGPKFVATTSREELVTTLRDRKACQGYTASSIRAALSALVSSRMGRPSGLKATRKTTP
jgi:hypothetical protein